MKRAFDAHQPARKAAGILGHHINVGDDGTVAMYLPATDHAKLEAFLESPDLKSTMKDAGVTWSSSITSQRPRKPSSASRSRAS